jgi:DNA polymerase-3 subunit alpha
VELVLVAADLDGEVEIELPERYPLTPQVIGALKTTPGVVHLEEF